LKKQQTLFVQNTIIHAGLDSNNKHKNHEIAQPRGSWSGVKYQ